MNFIQRVNNVFALGYPIKVYELWNHDVKWPAYAHGHAYIQIWYVLRGTFTHEIDGQLCQVHEGELLIVPPYVEHRVSAEQDSCAVYGCDFLFELLTEDRVVTAKAGQADLGMEDFISNLLQVRGKYVLPELYQKRIENILRKMLIVYQKKQPYSMIELKGYLLRLLAGVMQSAQHSDFPVNDMELYADNINDAIAYINEHLADHIYLEEVARFVSMSVRSFNHYFKKYTGRTYVDYLNMVRLDVAKTLLTETRLGIAHVGRRVGFPDPAYFNRQFKKYVGCTPGKYRDIHSDM